METSAVQDINVESAFVYLLQEIYNSVNASNPDQFVDFGSGGDKEQGFKLMKSKTNKDNKQNQDNCC